MPFFFVGIAFLKYFGRALLVLTKETTTFYESVLKYFMGLHFTANKIKMYLFCTSDKQTIDVCFVKQIQIVSSVRLLPSTLFHFSSATSLTCYIFQVAWPLISIDSL